ncbi:PEP-CTERM sorting domain-containing protein [Thalassotalea euphylliae]|uniref:PEP-CTERM sorting domain-containing protein n=1 Tax=Thalassotalea euphylliae TaxID=1655234 RepID=UPI00363734F5
MNTAIHNNLVLILVLAFCLAVNQAHAGLISVSVGNDGNTLVDGNIYALPDIDGQQTGPAPFLDPYGLDAAPPFGTPPPLDAPNVSWTFSYGAIVDTILSASLSFGIWDLDSGSSGSQLDAFSVDGSDKTTALDGLFEAANTQDSQYNVFTLNLSAADLAALVDGSYTVNLDVGGSGLITPLFGPGAGQSQESQGNGFQLVYSTLTINTQDSSVPPPNQIPEPNIIALLMLSLLSMGLIKIRR